MCDDFNAHNMYMYVEIVFYDDTRFSVITRNAFDGVSSVFFQRLLKLTQPTPEWIPSPEKRRRAREAQNDVKMTSVVDDFRSSVPPSFSTAVNVNGAHKQWDGSVDNPAYIHG